MGSALDLESFYSSQRQGEARYRGEYILTGIQLPEYDVSISDFKHGTLKTTIAQDLGIGYLLKAEEAGAQRVVEPMSGYIRQFGLRALAPKFNW